jgi:hypothetical protein
MIGIALVAALSTINGIPKTVDQAWVDLRSEGRAAWDADMRAAGLAGYWRTVGGGAFVLIREGAPFRLIGASDGTGFVVHGPAEVQVGNQDGLLEYRLNSGTAICFTGDTGYGCAVELSIEEMIERTKPAKSAPKIGEGEPRKP